jgi:flagellar hook protein FlgE
LRESYFFQKSISNSKYKLLVQSSLDNNIYVYRDAGTDKSYESVFNLTTASRVLDIDINAEGVLLVGFENGDMIEYTWDDEEG